MKVIEEKRELEEAIFRMRKKLLSISNSAAAAAGEYYYKLGHVIVMAEFPRIDNEVVDALVRPKNHTRRQSEPDSPSHPPTPKPNRIESDNEESPVSVVVQSQNGYVPLRDATSEQPSRVVSAQETPPLDLANHQDLFAPDGGSIPLSINWNSNFEQRDTQAGTVAGQLTPQDQSSCSFGALELTFPLDYTFSILSPVKTVTIKSPSIFAETILHACRKYVRLRNSDFDDEPLISHDLATYDWSGEAEAMNNIVQISEIGVHMLSAFAGLEPYIYGVVSIILILAHRQTTTNGYDCQGRCLSNGVCHAMATQAHICQPHSYSRTFSSHTSTVLYQ
jgi:hypothetical protein